MHLEILRLQVGDCDPARFLGSKIIDLIILDQLPGKRGAEVVEVQPVIGILRGIEVEKYFIEVREFPYLDLQTGLFFDLPFKGVLDSFAGVNATTRQMVFPGVTQSHEQEMRIPDDDGIGGGTQEHLLLRNQFCFAGQCAAYNFGHDGVQYWLCERLVQVSDQVSGVFEADGEAQQVLGRGGAGFFDGGAVFDQAVGSAEAGGAGNQVQPGGNLHTA